VTAGPRQWSKHSPAALIGEVCDALIARPALTVIVCFHDMRREAARTLHTLSARYQRDVAEADYRVVAVDNGSTRPLDAASVWSFGRNFDYHFWPTRSASPAAALNHFVRQARSRHVMCLIDGARMLSPGIIAHTLRALRAFPEPFVVTIGMHLGRKLQNQAILEGYDQNAEDQMLGEIDWQSNGYALFAVSTLAGSSLGGPLMLPLESNCFALRRETFLEIGGFDERFQSPGGGLVNLDFFKRALTGGTLSPVLLVGEATFHQLHGGVATNVPPAEHPWPEFAAEYRAIRGEEYAEPDRERLSPFLLGHFPREFRDLLRSGS
jgi:hypothetical protein